MTEVGRDNPAVDKVFEYWDVPGSPGCALAVSQDGTVIYSRGYGYANLDYDIPITPQTAFDIASVTKQFVAASVSLLSLEDKLSFDDNVRQWLPELPEYESPITLSHLVYHTSGLRDYLNLFPLAGRDDYYPVSGPQILEMMSRQRALVFSPGERYLYSNTGYMLLAQVVERASGSTLDEFTQRRIFKPLAMDASLMYDSFERIIPGRAVGYVRDETGRVRMVHNYNFDVPGDGQMYTTVGDLLRWDNHLHGDDRPAYYGILMQEGALNSGDTIGRTKGLFLGDYRGLRTVYHTGSSWGFRSVVERFVDAGLAVAIACNDDNANPQELAWRIADHYLADRLAPVSDRNEIDQQVPETRDGSGPWSANPGRLAEFAGTFHSYELDAIYRIAATDSGLSVRIEQEAPLAASAIADDRFGFEFRPQGWPNPESVYMDFTRDADGAIVGFELSSGTERGIEFEKLR